MKYWVDFKIQGELRVFVDAKSSEEAESKAAMELTASLQSVGCDWTDYECIKSHLVGGSE